MKNTQLLANRFREVILDGTFIAYTNYKQELEDFSWEIAVKKVDNLNTIADLAQHIHYYISGVKQVLNGGSLDIKDQFSFEFPPIISPKQWADFLQKFWKDAEEFANLVEQMNDEKLQENFVDEKYGTYLRNIDAMIEHAYYHLGQIVLIKKILEA